MTTILVVEDDDDLRMLVRWSLEAEGFEVYCASDGNQALEAIFRIRPDLAILDWMLPNLEGLAVCRMVREANRQVGTPVILVTGRAEDEDLRRGMAAGADSYLTKPFSMDVLIERVRDVLGRTAQPNDDVGSPSPVNR